MCRRDLLKFPTIKYVLHSSAKLINGLLSPMARKADSKAAYTLTDLIVLSVYSSRQHLFDGLVDLSLEELKERHDRTVQTLHGIVREQLDEYMQKTRDSA